MNGPAADGRGLPDCSGLDLLATLVAIVAPDGRCLWVNASFERVFGLPRRHMHGTSLFDWCADAPALRETLVAVSRNDYSSGRLEIRLQPPPGAAPFESLAVQAIVNQIDGSPNVVVELVEAEQQSRQDRAERASEQAQATKELVRNLAHEIRNPLGGIRGAAQLLEGELDPSLREYTQVIIGEADRLQALVDRLLAPHRQPQAIVDVNIHEVCERVLGLIEAEFPRGLNVARDYDVSIPLLRGDREQLIQAVLNIVRNATQALAERIAAGDARLVVQTRVARQATFAGERHRLALDLRVEDNGGGVAEAIRERIFFPLVSGRNQGSGLGLTLARSFVQQHGGTIDFESVPGRTVFKMLIPLH